MKIGGNTVQISKRYRVYLGGMTGLGYALVHCLFRLLSKEPIDLLQVLFQLVFFAFFWYFMFFFSMRKKQEEAIFEGIRPQELSFYGVAHQLINKSVIIGVLQASAKQLIFTPQATDFVESPLKIDFQNIRQVDVYKSRGLLNEVLLIHTNANRTFKFRVNEPQIWQTSIQNKIK